MMKDPARAVKLASRNEDSLNHLTRQSIGSESTRHRGGRNDNILAKKLMNVSDNVRYLVQNSLRPLLPIKKHRRAQIWTLYESLSLIVPLLGSIVDLLRVIDVCQKAIQYLSCTLRAMQTSRRSAYRL